MVVLKLSSLKSDIFLNPMFIPCFTKSIFFQGPGFAGSRFFSVQVFEGPSLGSMSGFRFLGSVSRIWVQILEVAKQFYF